MSKFNYKDFNNSNFNKDQGSSDHFIELYSNASLDTEIKINKRTKIKLESSGEFSPYLKMHLGLNFSSKINCENNLNIEVIKDNNPEMHERSTLESSIKISEKIIIKNNIESNSDLILYDESYIILNNIKTINIDFDAEIKIDFISNKEVILILDPNLNLIAQLDNYEDLMWNRRWRKPDDFELTMDKSKLNASYLNVNNYIAKKRGDIVHAGRIKNRELKKDESGETISVSGKGLGEIVENRIAYHKTQVGDGYDTQTGPAETVMKKYVYNNIIDPENTDRKIDKLKLEKDKKVGQEIHYKARFQEISEILYEIAKTSGLGWDIILDLDNKEFVFKVLYAKIRTGIRLTTKMDSVTMIGYKEKQGEKENTAIVAGQGSGSDRQIVEVSKNDL